MNKYTNHQLPHNNQIEQFLDHYKLLTANFSPTRVFKSVDFVLNLMHRSITSKQDAKDIFRKLKTINQAIKNITVNDIFQQVKSMFPSVFAFAQNAEQISLHPSQLYKCFTNALMQESFVEGRLTGRGGQYLKDIIAHIRLSMRMEFQYVEEFSDLLICEGGSVDLLKSYSLGLLLLNFQGVNSMEIIDSGTKLEMRQYDGFIHDFWRAMEYNVLQIMNPPLFLGNKCVVLSRFVEVDDADLMFIQDQSARVKSGLMNDQFRSQKQETQTMDYRGMKSRLIVQEKVQENDLRATDLGRTPVQNGPFREIPQENDTQMAKVLKILTQMQAQIQSLQDEVEDLKLQKRRK